MLRTFTSLALVSIFGAAVAIGSIAPAGATNAQAVLTVNGAVTNNCSVTQPSTLAFTYDPVANTTVSGTSSFTWDCTNGTAIIITVTGSNSPAGNDFDAVLSGKGLYYFLYNDLTCTSADQIKSGGTYSFTGTGTSKTYNVCGQADTTYGPNQTLPAGTYVDTVNFTFNYGP